MSKATKRKYVVREVMEEYVVPSEQQQVVRVLGSPGNNLHEVETALAQRFLVSMPPKYRKNIWIKRGDYLIVDPIEEGDKVKGEIVFILYKEHIKHLKHAGAWPEAFADGDCASNRDSVAVSVSHNKTKSQMNHENAEDNGNDEEEEEEEENDDDSDLFVNTNRKNFEYTISDSESSDEMPDENAKCGSEEEPEQ
uniref:probable RNA-binding protein EIF1AD n=1 Tax=Myxine glutinosa TaxID=7769 RepID=UPI00358EABDC